MFVKIIYKGRESVFECERYSMWDIGDRVEPTLMIEIRGAYNTDQEVFKNKNSEVYILNNEGKTIDTYRW